jgi:hypothetical protein
VLALAADPHDGDAVYVAEAAGNVKRIKLQVGQLFVEPVRRPSARLGQRLITLLTSFHTDRRSDIDVLWAPRPADFRRRERRVGSIGIPHHLRRLLG